MRRILIAGAAMRAAARRWPNPTVVVLIADCRWLGWPVQ